MTTRDVIVIGAGAAGSSAAFHLAKTGRKVTLLEKEKEQPIKACGGGMAASVQTLFPFNLSPVIDEVIKEVNFSWCLSDPVTAQLPGSAPFWIVRREKLDELITNKAIAEGVEFIKPFFVENLFKENSHWKVTSKTGKQLTAKAIVIADGSSSPWPQKFGLGPKTLHYASTTSVRLNRRGNLTNNTTRFEFGLVHHGFAWAFPIKEGVSVGVGTFIGQDSSDTNKVLETFLPSLGFNPTEGRRKEASLRVWNGHCSLHNDGIVVVGDAASLCDPFLAEGLRPALLSGKEAAYALNKWLTDRSYNLNNYTKAMKKKWGDSMIWGKRIAQVFYRFPKVGYQLGIKRPTAPQRIAEILSGNLGYGDIANRVIKRLLFQS